MMTEETVNQIISKFNIDRYEVFCQMLELKSQREIAESMELPLKTVKYHMGKIYKDLDIKYCNEKTESKRLVFTRTFLEKKYKYGLESVLNS